MSQPSYFNHAYTLLDQHKEEALARAMLPRVTNAYSTGDEMIDEYIGGGYGRTPNGYEIVLVFGSTGVNKSTFATQMILEPAKAGKQVAYFSLEDDIDDLYARIYYQCKEKVGRFGDVQAEVDLITSNIMVAPENDGYTLEEMAKEIENLFDMGIDIVVIDPLQFIFEASVVERTETEFNRQRLFMRQINNLIKRAARKSNTPKTLILVSHTNKGSKDDPLDSIMGSGANKQVPTKIIEIGRDRKDGTRYIHLHKTRFTEHRFCRHQVTLNKEFMTLHTIPGEPGSDWKNQVRQSWNRVG